jgi:DNA-damage-inducible protein D
MKNQEIENKHHLTFEQLKQTNESGAEYWFARDLQSALDYSSWDKFNNVIQKVMSACKNSRQAVDDHFSQVGKMVDIGLGAQRKLEDIRLSRYACYLIVQNGDPSKPVIANGQTYFAMQTRRQELADDKTFQRLKEDEKRLFLRNELKEHKALKVHPPYMYRLLKTNIYRHIFQFNTSSSVDRRGSLRWDEFSTIKVIIPPKNEQIDIANTLDTRQREIDLLKSILVKYKLQKRSLMQKLLTGAWRIKNLGATK